MRNSRDENAMSNNIYGGLMEIGRILMFSLACIGFIVITAFVYKVNQHESTLPLAFLTQIFIYTSIATLGLILSTTDIVFKKMSQLNRIVISSIICFIILLVFLSNAPVAPLSSILSFLTITIWFLLNLMLLMFAWYIYEKTVSSRYNSCLENFKLNKEDK